MAAPDLLNQLDQTLDALGDDPASLSPQAAAGAIDRWLNTLADADRDGLNNIASTLGEVRQQLLSTPLDRDALAGTLSRLADYTAEAAPSDDDLRPRLDRLTERLRRYASDLQPAPPSTPDLSDKTQTAFATRPDRSS